MKYKLSLNFIDTILVLLALICIGYSTYQTASGFTLAAGSQGRAWVLALIISSGLALMNFRLRTAYSEEGFGGKALVAIIIYISFATFSFLGNFNAFYSEYMKQELLRDDLELRNTELAKLNAESISAIEQHFKTDSLQEQITKLKITLLAQVGDPARPGIGPKAKPIISELEKVLGVKLTLPAGSPRQMVDFFDKQIENLLKQRLSKIESEENELVGSINKSISISRDSLEKALKTKDTNDDIEAIALAVKTYNQIGARVQGIVAEKSSFKFSPITSENVEIGKISHTLKSASKKENQEARWFTASLSLLIDLLVPLMILILTPINKTKKHNQNSYRFPNREKNRTSKSYERKHKTKID